eukprot:gene1667-1032_t
MTDYYLCVFFLFATNERTSEAETSNAFLSEKRSGCIPHTDMQNIRKQASCYALLSNHPISKPNQTVTVEKENEQTEAHSLLFYYSFFFLLLFFCFHTKTTKSIPNALKRGSPPHASSSAGLRLNISLHPYQKDSLLKDIVVVECLTNTYCFPPLPLPRSVVQVSIITVSLHPSVPSSYFIFHISSSIFAARHPPYTPSLLLLRGENFQNSIFFISHLVWVFLSSFLLVRQFLHAIRISIYTYMFYAAVDVSTGGFVESWKQRVIALDAVRRHLYCSSGLPPSGVPDNLAALQWKKMKVTRMHCAPQWVLLNPLHHSESEATLLEVEVTGERRPLKAKHDTLPPEPLLCPSTGLQPIPGRFSLDNEEFIQDPFFLNELYEGLLDAFSMVRVLRAAERGCNVDECSFHTVSTPSKTRLDSCCSFNVFANFRDSGLRSWKLRLSNTSDYRRFTLVVAWILGFDKLANAPHVGYPPLRPSERCHMWEKQALHFFGSGCLVEEPVAATGPSMPRRIGHLCILDGSVFFLYNRDGSAKPDPYCVLSLHQVRRVFYSGRRSHHPCVLFMTEGERDLLFLPTPQRLGKGVETMFPRAALGWSSECSAADGAAPGSTSTRLWATREVLQIVSVIRKGSLSSIETHPVIAMEVVDAENMSVFVAAVEQLCGRRVAVFFEERRSEGVSQQATLPLIWTEYTERIRKMRRRARGARSVGVAAVPIYENHTNHVPLTAAQVRDLEAPRRRLGPGAVEGSDGVFGFALTDIDRVLGEGALSSERGGDHFVSALASVNSPDGVSVPSFAERGAAYLPAHMPVLQWRKNENAEEDVRGVSITLISVEAHPNEECPHPNIYIYPIYIYLYMMTYNWLYVGTNSHTQKCACMFNNPAKQRPHIAFIQKQKVSTAATKKSIKFLIYIYYYYLLLLIIFVPIPSLRASEIGVARLSSPDFSPAPGSSLWTFQWLAYPPSLSPSPSPSPSPSISPSLPIVLFLPRPAPLHGCNDPISRCPMLKAPVWPDSGPHSHLPCRAKRLRSKSGTLRESWKPVVVALDCNRRHLYCSAPLTSQPSLTSTSAALELEWSRTRLRVTCVTADYGDLRSPQASLPIATSQEKHLYVVRLGGDTLWLERNERVPPPEPLLCPSTGLQPIPGRFSLDNEEFIQDPFFLNELYESLVGLCVHHRRARAAALQGRERIKGWAVKALRFTNLSDYRRFMYVIRWVLCFDNLMYSPYFGLPPYDPRNGVVLMPVPLHLWRCFKMLEWQALYYCGPGDLAQELMVLNGTPECRGWRRGGHLCILDGSVFFLHASQQDERPSPLGLTRLHHVRRVFYSGRRSHHPCRDLLFLPAPQRLGKGVETMFPRAALGWSSECSAADGAAPGSTSTRLWATREVLQIVSVIQKCLDVISVPDLAMEVIDHPVIRLEVTSDSRSSPAERAESVSTFLTKVEQRCGRLPMLSADRSALPLRRRLSRVWREYRTGFEALRSHRPAASLQAGAAAVPIYENHTNHVPLTAAQVRDLEARARQAQSRRYSARGSASGIVGFTLREIAAGATDKLPPLRPSRAPTHSQDRSDSSCPSYVQHGAVYYAAGHGGQQEGRGPSLGGDGGGVLITAEHRAVEDDDKQLRWPLWMRTTAAKVQGLRAAPPAAALTVSWCCHSIMNILVLSFDVAEIFYFFQHIPLANTTSPVMQDTARGLRCISASPKQTPFKAGYKGGWRLIKRLNPSLSGLDLNRFVKFHSSHNKNKSCSAALGAAVASHSFFAFVGAGRRGNAEERRKKEKKRVRSTVGIEQVVGVSPQCEAVTWIRNPTLLTQTTQREGKKNRCWHSAFPLSTCPIPHLFSLSNVQRPTLPFSFSLLEPQPELELEPQPELELELCRCAKNKKKTLLFPLKGSGGYDVGGVQPHLLPSPSHRYFIVLSPTSLLVVYRAYTCSLIILLFFDCLLLLLLLLLLFYYYFACKKEIIFVISVSSPFTVYQQHFYIIERKVVSPRPTSPHPYKPATQRQAS